jgi:hypothetical protein
MPKHVFRNPDGTPINSVILSDISEPSQKEDVATVAIFTTSLGPTLTPDAHNLLGR